MRKFGLIGKKLGHSFSKKYFTAKFEKEGIPDAAYELYELASIDQLSELLKINPELKGLNVTVPYKEAVIPFLDKLDEAAARIGAVNTIRIKDGETEGFNTDYIGFKDSLIKFFPAEQGSQALVLGTGGASKAVCAVLSDLGIAFRLVSRSNKGRLLTYSDITTDVLQEYSLLINTTPLGMHPDVSSFPPIPYDSLTPQHYLYDLVYSPEETAFLRKGKASGTRVINGLEMLYGQAEAAWEVWNRVY